MAESEEQLEVYLQQSGSSSSELRELLQKHDLKFEQVLGKLDEISGKLDSMDGKLDDQSMQLRRLSQAREEADAKALRREHRDYTSHKFNIEMAEISIGDVLAEGAFGTVSIAKWHRDTVAVKQLKVTESPPSSLATN